MCLTLILQIFNTFSNNYINVTHLISYAVNTTNGISGTEFERECQLWEIPLLIRFHVGYCNLYVFNLLFFQKCVRNFT